MTGWALWEGPDLVEAGQTELREFVDEVALGAGVLPYELPAGPFVGIRKLVVEQWVLYPWKADDLEFDEMRTSRGIGALEFIARHAGLEFVFQPATIKETSLAAGAGELFYRPLHPNRHANDAIMHGWHHVQTTMKGRKIVLPHATVVMADPDALRSPDA
jgi:hypothetical protein